MALAICCRVARSGRSRPAIEIMVPRRLSASRGRPEPASSSSEARSARPRHLVIDSTGLKVYGEGEWKVRQHGVGKRRTWRKMHLAVDADTGEILACQMTEGDAAVTLFVGEF
jgi:hypothetical protein